MEITNYLTECVQNNTPISFSKYGDGEFNCVFYQDDKRYVNNCDGDNYSSKLSDGLKKSFIYMVENSENSYLGRWHNIQLALEFEKLVNKKVNWARYHSLIFDKNNDENKAVLYKTIKQSKLKKIIVCNELLIKSKLLLDIDEVVLIPFNNWFDTQFDTVLQEIKEKIQTDGNHIVMTCCGMSAKVLICELTKSFPLGIYLDFGSALDIICTKRDSRGYNCDYEYFSNLLKECLPDNFEDDKYKSIYDSAKINLGLHIQ